MQDGATVDGATPAPITGAFSVIDRADEGIATKVRTRARPGHAHTLWYAIFNAPENCSDGACGDDDVFIDPSDHGAGFNAAQIAAARVSVVTGLEDPHGAVIIAIVQDHGAAHADPELLERHLTTFQGACNPECEDVQVAVHVP